MCVLIDVRKVVFLDVLVMLGMLVELYVFVCLKEIMLNLGVLSHMRPQHKLVIVVHWFH